MDPARSRALLVGASTFGEAAELDDLPSVPAGVRELQRLLIDPSHGSLEHDSCLALIDPKDVDDLDRALHRCAQDAEDTLLVYYAGHGVPSQRDGSLHLALRNTDRTRLRATAYPIDFLRDHILESNASTKVVIIDCCFS